MSVRPRASYDLLVIGGGSAGLVAADFGARFGARVLLIERGRIGGDCTWTGCIPSKTLLHMARIARESGGALGFEAAMSRVRGAIGAVYAFETPERLRDKGIDVEQGEAHFVTERSVEVEGRDFRGRRIVICGGAAPLVPPIPGLDAVPHLTHEEVFDMPALPRRLLILGGGPIGVELAQAFARLGSAVTLLEKEPRLLPIADPEAVEVLSGRLASDGVRIEAGLEVREFRSRGSEVVASSSRGEIAGDLVLVATGRRPRVDDLGLERAGVAFDAGGIRVDRRLRTTRRHIFAAGDVTGGFQFTHFAGWQGYVAARNALLPGSTSGVMENIPWAVFTDPEIAQVGYREDEARSRFRSVAVHRLPLDRVDRAQTTGGTEGLIKIVTSRSGRVLGATVVTPGAGELANELSVAMAARLSLQQLASAMHVYPTIGFGIQQLAADAALRRASNGPGGALARALVRRLRG